MNYHQLPKPLKNSIAASAKHLGLHMSEDLEEFTIRVLESLATQSTNTKEALMFRLASEPERET